MVETIETAIRVNITVRGNEELKNCLKLTLSSPVIQVISLLAKSVWRVVNNILCCIECILEFALVEIYPSEKKLSCPVVEMACILLL